MTSAGQVPVQGSAEDTPLRVAIVDDEPLARDVLRRLVEERPDLELVAEAGSGSEALRLLSDQRTGADLVLLDIEMPGLDGFQLLEEVSRRALTDATVVFVTAYNRYAVRAFETQAIDYLVKPVTPERFETTIERAIDSRRQLTKGEVQRLLADALAATPDRLLIKKGSRIVPVAVEEIDWIEASGDYVKLHIGPESHLIERTLSEMELLLATRGFHRIHRSALVNDRRIEGLVPLGSGRYQLQVTGGAKLVVSRTYSGKFKQQVL